MMIRVVDHLFPRELNIPPETFDYLVFCLWPLQVAHSTIVTGSGFVQQAFETCRRTNNFNIPLNSIGIERLLENHGASVAASIVKRIAMIPYDRVCWDTIDRACYLILRIAERGEVEAARQLIEIMVQYGQEDIRPETKAMREYMQLIFRNIKELVPLLEQPNPNT